MKNLITTTFTLEQEPNYITVAKHFMHDVGFFDLDIEKYEDAEAWTVSITYPIEYAEIYAGKLKTWNGLSFFNKWIIN